MGKFKKQKIDERIPRFNNLISPTFNVLKALGGSGPNEEILNQIVCDLSIKAAVADIPHQSKAKMTELSYQAAWAHTYLKKYCVIENSDR